MQKENFQKKVIDAIKNLSNNKFPGNNGLTKEFYKNIWCELKKSIYKFY